jgi:hypothetical protein
MLVSVRGSSWSATTRTVDLRVPTPQESTRRRASPRTARRQVELGIEAASALGHQPERISVSSHQGQAIPDRRAQE